MCGIAGILRFDGAPVDEHVLEAMTGILYHRGPDDAGTHVMGRAGLGHRRLAIQDLSDSGHQPMCNEDATIWLTFNGEIYNFVELRSELLAKGHTFKSATDSEVILHLYEELGDDCVDRLNGMFAFAIWDSNRNRLFCARDRLGIKPFHYHADGTQFVFASEIKALLANPAVPRAPDHQGIADFLFAGAPLGESTMFAGIGQLEPGHCLAVEHGRVTKREYWSLEYNYRHDRTLKQVVGELRELLEDAVRIHCRSDAPLGCHLSGGLDSSFVTAMAAKFVHPLATFSILSDGDSGFNEIEHARLMAETLGTQQHEKKGRFEDFGSLLPSLLWYMDYPPAGGHGGGYTYYLAAELAATHAKVSLTGHGGDELFAGYPAQFLTAYGTTDRFELPARAIEQLPFSKRLARLLRNEGLSGLLHRAALRARSVTPASESPRETWVRTHCGRPPERNSILDRSFVRSLHGYSPVERYLVAFDDAPTDQLLDRCLYHDLRTYLPQLLHKEDRASMAVSLESRVPLLDHRIAELMATVPPEQKVHGSDSKSLLRAAAKDLLPESILARRDKVPFRMPLKRWAQDELKQSMDELLRSEACLDRGVFSADAIRTESLDSVSKLAAVDVELWFRLFIDQDAEWLGKVRNLSKREGVSARSAMRGIG